MKFIMTRIRQNTRLGFVVILGIFTASISCGPHKISIIGQSILRESTDAMYTIVVQNTANKDLENIVVSVQVLHDTALKLYLACSDTLRIDDFSIPIENAVEGVIEFLPVNETVTMDIYVKARSLQEFGDLKSLSLKAKVSADKTKESIAQKDITIFQPIIKNSYAVKYGLVFSGSLATLVWLYYRFSS